MRPIGPAASRVIQHGVMTRADDLLAIEAVRDVADGMVVGLGTGRAASRAIEMLARKVQSDNLAVECVATSVRSAELARSHDLTVRPMRDVPRVDLLFDGVDELDPSLAMTKGGGGAMTREKIVAEAAERRIYLMQQSKRVRRLGERMPLPVEALEFGLASIAGRLDRLGLTPRVRTSAADPDAPVRTDEGNLILDCKYGDAAEGDLFQLDRALNAIPGVVGHGLFVDQADVVIIEPDDRDGPLEFHERRR